MGHLVNKADFERLLATRSVLRSTHFAVHHVCAAPLPPAARRRKPAEHELSTGPAPGCPELVDDLPSAAWLGCVVPKRHAKRAVTRSLLKRQVRSCFQRQLPALPKGIWLVRLREAFPVAAFPSARSDALRGAAREELDRLFARAAGMKT